MFGNSLCLCVCDKPDRKPPQRPAISSPHSLASPAPEQGEAHGDSPPAPRPLACLCRRLLPLQAVLPSPPTASLPLNPHLPRRNAEGAAPHRVAGLPRGRPQQVGPGRVRRPPARRRAGRLRPPGDAHAGRELFRFRSFIYQELSLAEF